MSSPAIPELPYFNTSGWSGSSTSKERALKADREGTTSRRQKQTLLYLKKCGSFGATWKELSEWCGLHHGSSSGVLSVLHLTNRIARLHKQSRGRCKVYVLPEFINGRQIEEHGRKKSCPHCGGCL